MGCMNFCTVKDIVLKKIYLLTMYVIFSGKFVSAQPLVDRDGWMPVLHAPHYASKLELFLTEQAKGRLSHSKVTRKPLLLDELTSFGQRETAPAILSLY